MTPPTAGAPGGTMRQQSQRCNDCDDRVDFLAMRPDISGASDRCRTAPIRRPCGRRGAIPLESTVIFGLRGVILPGAPREDVMTIRVEPLHPSFFARIEGVDLRQP